MFFFSNNSVPNIHLSRFLFEKLVRVEVFLDFFPFRQRTKRHTTREKRFCTTKNKNKCIFERNIPFVLNLSVELWIFQNGVDVLSWSDNYTDYTFDDRLQINTDSIINIIEIKQGTENKIHVTPYWNYPHEINSCRMNSDLE